MPIATDSGYLPDWLAALIGQGRMGANVPTGLFSDTAASPSPAVGLLSSLPQFTGVRPNAPAFQGGNTPDATNSYPSMTMPQDPGPMSIGPGAASSFTGVNPNAPFTANGPASVQDQYANVPLPPRRPASLTDFQAQSAEDPADINAPPPGRPNANVVGTAASGAPEVTAQQSPGLGDYLGKAANAIGSIYGAGGPGDALIALGLSNRTNGASIQALNAMNANRTNDVKLQLLKNQLALQNAQQNATYKYFLSKGVSPEEAQAATLDPNLAKKKFEEFAGASGYDTVTLPDNSVWRISKTDPNDRTQLSAGRPDLPKVIGEDESGNKTYGISGPSGEIIPTDAYGRPMAPGARGTAAFGSAAAGGAGTPASVSLPPVKEPPSPGTKEASDLKAKGEAYLSTLDPGFANTVRAIAEGREPYPVGLRTPAALKLKNAINTYDPTFDYTNSQARAETRKDFSGDGKTGQALDAGRTTIGHVGHMSDIADQLAKTNTSIPAFNKWKNQAAINFGGGLPAMKYDTWAALVAKEATSFYSPGGGTYEEREDLKDKLTSAGSPAQLHAVLDTIGDAVSSKVSSLQTRWHTGMGVHAPDFPILTPENEAVLAKLKERAASSDPSSGSSQATSPPPPPAFGDVRRGYRYIGGPNANPNDENNWVKIGSQT